MNVPSTKSRHETRPKQWWRKTPFSLLQPYPGLKVPPPAVVKLWGEGGRGIWVDNSWGTRRAHPPVDHEDGARNHAAMEAP
jgi:hypothetical protein